VTARQRARPAEAVAAAVAAVALGLGAAGCESGQDPGVTPSSSGGAGTTSNTLGACPPGGPDATTPAAGCLDADGRVQRPDEPG
jgi:hypothetical protein